MYSQNLPSSPIKVTVTNSNNFRVYYMTIFKLANKQPINAAQSRIFAFGQQRVAHKVYYNDYTNRGKVSTTF